MIFDISLQVPKDKEDPLSQIQKSFQESNVKRLEVENVSLKEENTRLVNDNRSLTAKLEALEIRNKHLALAANKKVST
jgi:FtsZ-binding cell division protein ZapB